MSVVGAAAWDGHAEVAPGGVGNGLSAGGERQPDSAQLARRFTDPDHKHWLKQPGYHARQPPAILSASQTGVVNMF